MIERLTEEEFKSLLVRRVNRDGTAERLCTKAHGEISWLRARVAELEAEIEQIYMDKAGESI